MVAQSVTSKSLIFATKHCKDTVRRATIKWLLKIEIVRKILSHFNLCFNDFRFYCSPFPVKSSQTFSCNFVFAYPFCNNITSAFKGMFNCCDLFSKFTYLRAVFQHHHIAVALAVLLKVQVLCRELHLLVFFV